MRKRGLFYLGLLAAAFIGLGSTLAYADEPERVQKATTILKELTGAEDNAIPNYVLERAEGIIVIPSFMKGGFVVGAEHGKGIVSVRDRTTSTWSPPAFVQMSGGSFGAQIGLQSTDLVFVVVDRSGMDQLLQDKFTLGGDLSVAAGPIGRSARAATDIHLEAKVLAYSRSKGLFAGATLNGSALKLDEKANEKFYKKPLTTRAILFEHRVSASETPALAKQWVDTLTQVTKGSAPVPTSGR